MGLDETLDAVRRTNAAHLDALEALQNAFHAETAALRADRAALEAARGKFAEEMDSRRSRDDADVGALRYRLQKDRAALDCEAKKHASALFKSAEETAVRLNVGGVRFETSRAVLTRIEDCMLGRMFGRMDHMLRLDSEGNVFIDRDGARFGLILDFLRDNADAPKFARRLRGLAETETEALLVELDFYGLLDAVLGEAASWIKDSIFAPGPCLNAGRYFCAAILDQRRVVVLGGYDEGSVQNGELATCEVLDLDSQTFHRAPSMLARRSGCAALKMDAHRVLVLGGFSAQSLDSTEVLDLATMTFSKGPMMRFRRNGCAAVRLDAGRILVVGGSDGSMTSSTEILSLETMAFARGPDMLSPRAGCAALNLGNGRIVVFGGSAGAQRLDTTEVLDLECMTFQAGPSMRSKRSGCAGVQIDETRFLIVGGRSDEGFLGTTEVLDTANMSFRAGPVMAQLRHACAAVTTGFNEVLIVGGYDGAHAVDTTEILKPVPRPCAPEGEDARLVALQRAAESNSSTLFRYFSAD